MNKGAIAGIIISITLLCILLIWLYYLYNKPSNIKGRSKNHKK